MKKLKYIQNGGITILLVILVGLGVMAGVGSLANSVGIKKETGVAAHAQSNAQMLAWIGTNVFYEYIKAQGAQGLDTFKLIGSNGLPISLRSTSNQTVVAENILIEGVCAADGDICEISADIRASSLASHAANSINVRYKMKVKDGTVVTDPDIPKLNLSGTTLVDGKIYAEKPGTKAEINVKGGDLWLNADAELKNFSELTFNVEGDVIIHCTASNCGDTGQMNINAGGYIYITDLGIGHFGDLSAKEYIQASGINAKNLSALKYVNLSTGSHVENISAGTDVNLDGGLGLLRSTAGNIEANRDVKVSWSTAQDIKAKRNVSVINGGAVNNILANGNVDIGTALNPAKVNGDIEALGSVSASYGSLKNVKALKNIELGLEAVVGSGSVADGNLHSGQNIKMWYSSSAKNITATGSVQLGKGVLLTGSEANGDISAGGQVEAYYNAKVRNITTAGGVKLGVNGLAESGVNSPNNGTIKAKGKVEINEDSTVGDIFSKTSVNVSSVFSSKAKAGNICAPKTSDISTYRADTGSKKSENSGQCSFPTPSVPGAPSIQAFAGVDTVALANAIDEKTKADTPVDVRKYKDEANYIFTKSNGIKRVYLNKLKNLQNGSIYMYLKDPADSVFKQYIIDTNGNQSIVGDGKGLHIGKYTMGSTTYVGAICESINGSRLCTSPIVSYVPRVGDKDQILGTLFETMYYDSNLNNWTIKNLVEDSSINNATIAPGIFYFEGHLEIHGRANIRSDSSTNAYTNTFLAEGDVTALVVSPRIYSPYNILRVKPDASIICNRNLSHVNGTVYSSAPGTSPSTNGYKFLVPTNLCKDATHFSYSMNRDPFTRAELNLTIDGITTPKLDLGHVAIMSNKVVRIGTCTQIYGDVLARERVETTALCGITSEEMKVVGQITSQNQSNSIWDNLIALGSKIVVSDKSLTGDPNQGGGSGLQLDTDNLEMTWAKSL